VLERVKRLLAARAWPSGAQADATSLSHALRPYLAFGLTASPYAPQGTEGTAMTDTPQPPPPPQRTLVWIAVAALVLVLAVAVWRGWS
jgi:hypothetical protein